MPSFFESGLIDAVAAAVEARLAPRFQALELKMDDFTTAISDLKDDFAALATDIKAAVDKIAAIPNLPPNALADLQALHQQAQDFKANLEAVNPPASPPDTGTPPTP